MTNTPYGANGQPGTSVTLFFNDYWFTTFTTRYFSFSPSYFGVSLVFVTIFFAQILTLGFGFTTLFKRRKMAQYLSLISCLFVITAMAFASTRVTDEPWTWLNPFLAIYGLGYWLIYPSIALFLYTLFPKLPNNLERQKFSQYALGAVGILILAVSPFIQFLIRNFLLTPVWEFYMRVRLTHQGNLFILYLLRDGPFCVLMIAGLVLYIKGRKKFWKSLGKHQNTIYVLLITLGLFLSINGFFYSWAEYSLVLWFISGTTLLADNLKQITSKSFKPESLDTTDYDSAQR
jgi:hypothetical protein